MSRISKTSTGSAELAIAPVISQTATYRRSKCKEQGDESATTTTVAVRTDVAALIAGLVTVTLWGSAFVGIRAAGATLSPGALALGRLVVSSAILGTVALARRDRYRIGATYSRSRLTGCFFSPSTASPSMPPNGASTPARRQCSSTRGPS